MARPGEPKSSERRIAARERQLEALNLKRAGADYRTIARQLGYGGPSGAHKAVQTALREIIREPAEDLITLELDRLDRMFLGHWPAASRGNKAATDACLKIMERRAKLLGLDAPVKKEITLHTCAELVALRYGLDPSEVLAEAESILAEASS